MKRLIASIIILSLLLLSGCAKGSTQNGTKDSSAVQSEQGKSSTGQNEASNADNSPQKGVDKNGKVVKAPPLNSAQKAQVNEKVTSVINSLNDVIKGLREAQDIDLSGI